MELVSQMTVIAFGVGVICFICNLAYNYLYHGASQLLSPNEDKFPDMMEIARCLVLFFCLSMYTPIAQTIVGTMEVINEATSLTSERAQEFAQFMAQVSHRTRRDDCRIRQTQPPVGGSSRRRQHRRHAARTRIKRWKRTK